MQGLVQAYLGINGYLEGVNLATYSYAYLIFAIVFKFKRTVIESVILTVNSNTAQTFDVIKVVGKLGYVSSASVRGWMWSAPFS